MHTMDEMTRAGCTSRRGIRHWVRKILGWIGPLPVVRVAALQMEYDL